MEPPSTASMDSNQDGNLARMIEGQIAHRTWGRVRMLAVSLEKDRIVVHGITTSYYVKQLALKAIREVLPSTDVDLNIRVSSA